jgi:hypothetical protein
MTEALALEEVICDSCEDEFLRKNLTGVNRGSGLRVVLSPYLFCEACAKEYAKVCHDCEEIWETDVCYKTDYGWYVCPRCIKEYFTCYDCGQFLHDTDYGDAGRCVSCSSETTNRPVLHNTDYEPEYWHTQGKPPWYGIEIETDGYTNSSMDAAVQDLRKLDFAEDLYLLKQDASLDNGIEIVTQPLSLPVWSNSKQDLEKILSVVKNNGGSANHLSCGLHVHRSRRDLSEITIAKLITATVKLQSYIIEVAGRNSAQYASYSFGEGFSKATKTKIIYDCIAKKGVKDRQVALNLTNAHTIEFRIFKGTMSPAAILAKIQFCDAFVSWCKQISFPNLVLHHKGALWCCFIQYVNEQKVEYKELIEKLDALNFRREGKNENR